LREPPRIVDLVFAREPKSGARRVALGALIVVVFYAGVLALAGRRSRLERPPSVEEVARVPDAIAVERAVDMTPPVARPEPAPKPVQAVRALPVARASRAQRARASAPAQASQLAAVAPSPPPLDVSGAASVVGSGSTYAGGVTSSAGTNRAPASGAVASRGKGDGTTGARSGARPVSLDQAAWNCPWPAEADAEQVDEQTVVLRVTVRPDGHAERVDVLSDPGFGFGAAARLCALRTAFVPARDPTGQPVAAPSPPIRVHFFR
jgi:protein TonB